MTTDQRAALANIKSFVQLVAYLRDEMGWPIVRDSFEDVDDLFYDFTADELGIDPKTAAKITEIKRLKPLSTIQPWGIFFVKFEPKKLPVVALRRILSLVAMKKRASANSAERTAWAADDLLFISNYGDGEERQISFAHFSKAKDGHDLPTLKVLGWDNRDTALHLDAVARELTQQLAWPGDDSDIAAWRTKWCGAFTLAHREVVTTSKDLSIRLAKLAGDIRDRINSALAIESDRGPLTKLLKAFQTSLVHDLDADGFADMYAQTIAYGLLSARIADPHKKTVDDFAGHMRTNPFLRELMETFIKAGGRRGKAGGPGIDFDELGVSEVVQLLDDANMEAVVRDFGDKNQQEDPVIHFYELFLKEYDSKKRMQRGVFYTPSPVVQFIIKSVDEILKAEFDIEDGLASTITWGEMMARNPELKLPNFCTTATPFVQVLDPATGTGTFIVEVITQVHTYMLKKWSKLGKITKPQWQPLWVDYVRLHLLPRLYAFELMMAPYAIAHMKVSLKLAETGYTFPENGPRVNVFLTNALEPAHAINPGLAFEAPMLAHEAAAANRVKEQLAATVVVGNPPYSGNSGNQGEWITQLMRTRLPDGADGYFRFNDADLGERNPKWVNNDYVKFIRLGQSRLAMLGAGVLGYITSNSYLESPTFRGVRQSLLHTLPHLRIVDLHGNSKRGETAGGDENVFEITEGVAIAVGNVLPGFTRRVEQVDLTGPRQTKYKAMMAKGLQLLAPLLPTGEKLQLVRSDSAGVAEYECGWPLPTIAPMNSVGIVTARDALCIQFTEKQAWDTVSDFANRDAEGARKKYALGGDSRDWQVKLAQSDVRASGPNKKNLQPILYRPFDIRQTYYTGQTRGFLCMPRPEVMRHMLTGQNFGLISCRQMSQIDEDWSLAGVSRLPIEGCAISNKTKEINYLFPLWRYLESGQSANLSSAFIATLQSVLKLPPVDYRSEDATAPLNAEKIFFYIFAIQNSKVYRQRYAAFLRTDFPRIPIPGSRILFDTLAKLGRKLVAWHLLEHPDVADIAVDRSSSTGSVSWYGTDFSLVKVAEKSRELADVQGTDDKVGKVFVNATSGFANVHQSIWQHTIGSYQVLHKWLDDRRKAGRSLSQDDVTHWLRVYAALQATQKLMQKVDEAIEANGGWPDAFSQNHPPPDAATRAAEQMVQREQLKVQKKAATASQKRAASASPTGATSLFDFDDDLDGLAAASGAPPRPKARATPAKAVGGKAAGSTTKGEGITDVQAMCAIRAVLARSEALSRQDLIQLTGRELGFSRNTPHLSAFIAAAIRVAIRRGVADNTGAQLTLLVKDIAGYDRKHLKAQLLAAVRVEGGTCSKADAPKLLARSLGYARTGANIANAVESLLRSLVRSKQIESKAGQIRILRR